MIRNEPWLQRTAVMDLAQLRAQQRVLQQAGSPNPVQVARLWAQELDIDPDLSVPQVVGDAMEYVTHTLAPLYEQVQYDHDRGELSPRLEDLHKALTAYHGHDYAEAVRRFLEVRDLHRRGDAIDLFVEIREFLHTAPELLERALDRGLLDDRETEGVQQALQQMWDVANKCLEYPSFYNKSEWARVLREWETFWVPMLDRA